MTFSFSWFGNSSNDAPISSGRRDSAPGEAEASELASTPDPRDVETVHQIREGNADTFTQLFRKHHRRLWAFAYDLTGSGDQADEVVQDVFATLWTRRAEWQVSHSIAEYLFGAVRNRAYKLRRHLAVVDRTAAGVASGDPSPAMSVAPASPAEAVEHGELTDSIAAAIRAMPPGRRTAILLRWHDQMSYEEIGRIMGVSAKAVSLQLMRARDDLRTALKSRM